MTSPTGIRRERDLRPTGANRMTRRRRHASALLDARESLKAVSQYLGHTDPALALRVYASGAGFRRSLRAVRRRQIPPSVADIRQRARRPVDNEPVT